MIIDFNSFIGKNLQKSSGAQACFFAANKFGSSKFLESQFPGL